MIKVRDFELLNTNCLVSFGCIAINAVKEQYFDVANDQVHF